MCDTQVIRHNGATYFAKNSDREPDEPQYIRYYPPVRGDTRTTLKTTYIEIDQVPDRHAVILSQPSWMWGAEIGVNEHGLVIGNEAVFTKVVDKTGVALLGMDILRLALERCRTAPEAIQCIDRLLREYGQGGPAGFRDKKFRYDNSFIIADANEAWVLETAARHWVARRVERFDAISNALCIGEDFGLHSEGLHEFAREQKLYSGKGGLNFREAFDTRFMKFMGRAEQRRSCSLRTLAALESPTLPDLAASLRSHVNDDVDFSRHGNGDVCMHAGGVLRPSQTTGSMLVRLEPGAAPEIFVTGTSAPCLSLFQPVSFETAATDTHPYLRAGMPEEGSRWQRFEEVHHLALRDRAFAEDLRASRDELEPIMYDASLDIGMRSSRAVEWLEHWVDRSRSVDHGYRWYSPYERYWESKRGSFTQETASSA